MLPGFSLLSQGIYYTPLILPGICEFSWVGWRQLDMSSNYKVVFYILYRTAPSNSTIRCNNCYISTAFPYSRSNNYTEPQVWYSSNFFKFSTNCISSSCCPPRAKVRFTFFLSGSFAESVLPILTFFYSTKILFFLKAEKQKLVMDSGVLFKVYFVWR